MKSTFEQALAFHTAGRLEEAEALYRQVTDDRLDWAAANLGVILRLTGRLEEAEAVLRRAIAADPTAPGPRYTLGMTLLSARKYAEGWRMYDARRNVHGFPYAPLLKFPEWRGEDLTGKRILVLAEQGQGDQILLSRFIPHLKAVAGEVHAASARSLTRLLSQLPVTWFYPADWDALDYDYWTPMGAVPMHLGLEPADAPAPYLTAQEKGSAGGVGLMMQGAPRNPNNASRLPTPAVERAIRGLADFVDLAPEASGAKDFLETAEIIAGLKLVVTVDTSVAHLAGAMGKPTLILMSRPAIDWYANWDDDRTPWYPSVRLIRQDRPGDWAGVIGRLAGALAEAGFAA